MIWINIPLVSDFGPWMVGSQYCNESDGMTHLVYWMPMFCWWLPAGLLNSPCFCKKSNIFVGKNHWCNWCNPCFFPIVWLLFASDTSDFSLVKSWNFPLCGGLPAMPGKLRTSVGSCTTAASARLSGLLEFLGVDSLVKPTAWVAEWVTIFEIGGRIYHSTTFCLTFYHIWGSKTCFHRESAKIPNCWCRFFPHRGPPLRLCQLWPHSHALRLSARKVVHRDTSWHMVSDMELTWKLMWVHLSPVFIVWNWQHQHEDHCWFLWWHLGCFYIMLVAF